MSIEPDREQIFQYGTFGVIGLIVFLCLCFALIFVNPGANPISALRPLVASPTVLAYSLPATWTPTATNTPTPTSTSTATPTATNIPTETPIPTNTRPPTLTPLPTLRPPIIRPPTQRPPAPLPTWTPVPPTAPPATAHFSAIKGTWTHDCNQPWSVSGTIWANGYGNGFVTGTLVVISLDDGRIVGPVAAGTGSFAAVNPGYYEFTFKKNARGDGFIAVVDPNGNLLSPKYDIGLTSHCGGSGDINQLTVDFTRN